MTSRLPWEQRAHGILPGFPTALVAALEALPRAARSRAIDLALSASPLPRDLERELVDEVDRCWADSPLPRPLPELIDAARRIQLTLLVERRAATAEGPVATGRHLDVQSLQPLEALLAGGRSAVLLTPTFGPWEVIAPALARRGYSVGVLDLRPPSQRPAHPVATGPGLDLQQLPSSGFARPLVRFATGGRRVIVALGDEGCGARWANGTLLGRSASIGGTPFELARHHGLGILPVFAVRELGRNRLRVEAALRISDTGRGLVDLDTTAGRWLKLVDRYVARHPDHYLPFLLARRLRRMDDPLPLFADAGEQRSPSR